MHVLAVCLSITLCQNLSSNPLTDECLSSGRESDTCVYSLLYFQTPSNDVPSTSCMGGRGEGT